MASEDEVRKVSEQFYAALNRMAIGERGTMADVWSHSASATAMHPIGGCDVGWEAIGTSFDQVAELASNGKVELKDQLIRVVGDVAYEVGIEQGELTLGGHPATIEHRVTNIYERQGDTWKLVHHHTDTSSAMLDILAKLQAVSK